MQRHSSKGSVTSVTSSSKREKKPLPTHMIIQRERDNQMVLLPVKHLVHSSVTGIKLNNMATFKSDLNGRKQERGRVIQIGNEEECMEQLQVFEMVAEVDEQVSTIDDDDEVNEKEINNKQGKNNTNTKKQLEQSLHSNERLNRESNLDSIRSIKSTKIVVKAKENLKSKYLQIENEDMNKTSSSEEDSFFITQKDAFNDEIPTKKSVNTSKTTIQRKTTTNPVGTKLRNENHDVRQGACKSQIIIGAQTTRNDLSSETSMLKNSNIDEEQQELNENNIDLIHRYKDLSKKHKELLTQNIALQTEVDRLVEENESLKRTTMPMPDAAGRAWFIKMGNFFSKKGPDTNIEKYAKMLKVNAGDLVDCISNTTSSTARQVVRLLYSPMQLATMSGPDIPKEERRAIQQFAESQKGFISKYAFNEAIDGVFRSFKSNLNKQPKQKENKSLSKGSNENRKKMNNINKGQTTLKQMMVMSKKKNLQSNHSPVDNENSTNQENNQDNE